MNEKIKSLMELLQCSEEEAKQIIADDERIDKGEKLFEQTVEQKANSKKYRQSKGDTVYNFTKRDRKADVDKREIIQVLDDALCDLVDNVVVANVERQIDFEFNGRRFRVVLSAPRK